MAAQGGDYWRLLTPGEYEITVSMRNYLPLTKRVLVTNPTHQEAYVINFDLESATNQGQRTWVSVAIPIELVNWNDNSPVIGVRNGTTMFLSTMLSKILAKMTKTLVKCLSTERGIGPKKKNSIWASRRTLVITTTSSINGFPPQISVRGIPFESAVEWGPSN